ncbi:MAG: lyase family protein, partial [Spirochaeta sp.]
MLNTELFAELSSFELEYIDPACDVHSFHHDEDIEIQDVSVTRLYFVYSGSIRMFRAAPDGSEKKITIFFCYEFSSETVLVNPAERTTSHARAYGPTVLIGIDKDLLPLELVEPVKQACDEIAHGMLHNQFIVDLIQGGAGTSTNMNANEIIANRVLEILGRDKGEYRFGHPNNHINLSQSTNGAYPTCGKNRAVQQQCLAGADSGRHFKAAQFSTVLKMGRTQLQDAVPMTLGQAFQ